MHSSAQHHRNLLHHVLILMNQVVKLLYKAYPIHLTKVLVHHGQPMHYKDMSLIVNGEIWNYKELRKEYESRGYTFNSNSDSEVILYLYAEGELGAPKYMSLGLHLRIIGRPGRIGAFEEFLEHITSRQGVWIPTRLEIAEHFAGLIPAPNTQE